MAAAALVLADWASAAARSWPALKMGQLRLGPRDQRLLWLLKSEEASTDWRPEAEVRRKRG